MWKKHGWGYYFLVCSISFGPEDDEWLSHKIVKDYKFLDGWYPSWFQVTNSAIFLVSFEESQGQGTWNMHKIESQQRNVEIDFDNG